MTNLIYTPMCVNEKIDELIEQLITIMDEIEKWLKKAPDGSVRNFKEKGKMRYILTTDYKKYKRIRPGNDKFQIYMQKRYYKKVLILLKNGIPEIKSVNKNYLALRLKIQNEYSILADEIKKVIEPIDMSNEEVAKKWQEIPFIGNPMDNSTDFYTNRGEHVRSKSEVEEANKLDKCGFYYKYECPIKLSDSITYYPDFTIWDPVMRHEVYWEHFGQMGDPDYAIKTAKKLKNYLKAKLFLGEHLIFTMELDGFPLGTTEINLTIGHHLEHRN